MKKVLHPSQSRTEGRLLYCLNPPTLMRIFDEWSIRVKLGGLQSVTVQESEITSKTGNMDTLIGTSSF